MLIIKKINPYIKLFRIKHYIKNFLLFIPVIFYGEINTLTEKNLLLGFISFSLTASSIYIINDLRDIEADRAHPKKKDRPLAKGSIMPHTARLCAVGLVITAAILNLAFIKSIYALLFLGAFFVLNLLYSFFLKTVVLADITCIAAFYVIRVYYGASAANVPLSSWLFLTTVSMSFYLALGKRRGELTNEGSVSRSVLNAYNVSFLDKFMYVCLSCTLVFYSLWCFTKETSHLFFTVPLVFIICMRYSLIIEGSSSGDPTEVLLNDKVLLALMALYCLSMAIILFLPGVK